VSWRGLKQVLWFDVKRVAFRGAAATWFHDPFWMLNHADQRLSVTLGIDNRSKS
jgi:hypothetical protein